MRILITADPEIPVPPLLYGGIERIIDSLVEGLIQNGHTVALVANPNSKTDVKYFFPWSGNSSTGVLNCLKNIKTLNSVIKEIKPDVIHSFSRLLYLVSVLPFDIPKIMSYQRHPSDFAIRSAIRISRGTLTFTGCSDYLCSIGKSIGGVWETIFNFVDLEKYTFNTIISENAPLVFLGRIEFIKGTHIAIQVAKKSNKKLIIAGNRSLEGQEYEYFKNQILPYCDGENISYIGSVDDKQKDELLRNASALLFPIQWEEPFGIVMIEALACGTPVIGLNKGAVPEVIQNGFNGFVCNDVSEMIESVNNIYDINRKNCRLSVDNNYSNKVIVKEYENLYYSCINK